jgi:hypothetical protein
MRADRYVMLVSSLPHLGRLFRAQERPLTRIQLERRLRLLEPEDAGTLRRIENRLRWAVLAPGAHDREQAERGRDLVAGLAESTLREVVARRLEARTLVAALRRRRDGEAAPDDPAALGYHRQGATILRHWRARGFGLARQAPWVADAEDLLAASDSIALERLLLQQAWSDLDQLGRGHAFDFPAVVLYVLKWDLMDRWMRYDARAGRQRFERVAADALSRYGEIVAPEPHHV